MADGMEVADLFASLGLRPNEQQWERGTGLIEGVKAALAGLAALVGLHVLKGFVDDTVDLADHLDGTSMKLGVATDALQELGFAAASNKSSAEELEAAMGFLQKTMVAAKDGSKEARKAFRDLGVDMRDLEGETLDQNLEVIAEAFSKMPDGAEKATLAMEIFGRQGRNLIPLLNQGQAGIVELRNEARELGVVMSEDTIARLNELDDTQTRLKAGLTGLRNEFVAAILPALEDVIGGMLEWFKANRKLISSTLTGFIDALAIGLRALAFVIGTIIDGWTLLVTTIVDSPIGDAVRAAGSAIFGVLNAAARALADFVNLFISGTASASDFFGFIADSVVAAWDRFTGLIAAGWREIKKFYGAVWREVVRFYGGIARAVRRAVQPVIDFFVGIATAIKNAFTAVFDFLAGKVLWVWDQVKRVGRFLESIGEGITDAGRAVVNGVGDFLFGDEDAPDTLGADGKTSMMVPMRPAGSVGPTPNINVDTQINIDAKNADAAEVATIAHDTFKQNLKRELINAQAVVS